MRGAKPKYFFFGKILHAIFFFFWARGGGGGARVPLGPYLGSSLCAGFPCLAKVVERGWGKILALYHRAGRGWV